jgi:hypothetical protein
LTKREGKEIHGIRLEHHPYDSVICTYERDPHQFMGVTRCKYCNLPDFPERLDDRATAKLEPPKLSAKLMEKLKPNLAGEKKSEGLTKQERLAIRRFRRAYHPNDSAKCTYEPDPLHLMVVTPCKYCNLPDLPERLDNITVDWYNAVRRSFKVEHGLTSILVPLTRASADLILEAGRKNGIVSNTALVHVTFVEGLPPIAPERPHGGRSEQRQTRDEQIEGVRSASRSWPGLQIMSANCVPTLSDHSMLVVLELQHMSDSVVHALQPLLQQTRMPQWPLHCAVGVVDKHKADASAARLARALQGTVLSLQPESIRELVATQFERRVNSDAR